MSAQGSSGRNTRVFETPLVGESVTGDHSFELNCHAPRNNLLDYFYFVDGDGVPVDATGGTVIVTLAPVAGLYQSVDKGAFGAIEARSAMWCKPNGFGKAVSIKISLDSITGPAVGFRALVTQNVS